MKAKHITKKLEVADRLECTARKPAYIMLKDHKKNFNINPKCLLINSAKSKLVKVSKTNVENTNKNIREKFYCNQWTNTSNFIDWFQNIANKGHCILFQFDMEEFYPSIPKHFMFKATEHAKLYTCITQQQLDIILLTSKSLLFSKDKSWKKTINESLFDISMGNYDSAQNVYIYWDDGLACLHKTSQPVLDKIWKDIIRTFWENFVLKITIIANVKAVNFLDVKFYLCTVIYQPYKKLDDTTTYINTFKDQFYKYSNSFKYKSKANSTELSEHFLEMKRKGIKNPIMHWSVIDHAKPYKNVSRIILFELCESLLFLENSHLWHKTLSS